MSVEAGRHLAEDQPQLHAGQVGAQAVVGAAAAERDVVVRAALDVEAERLVEDLFVAVGRDVPHHDLVAGLDLLAAQLEVAHRGAAEVHHRASTSGGSPRPRRRCSGPGRLRSFCELVGVVDEGEDAVRGRVAGRLVAGDGEQQAEELELLLAELVAVDLGVDQPGDDVVARDRPRRASPSPAAYM